MNANNKLLYVAAKARTNEKKNSKTYLAKQFFYISSPAYPFIGNMGILLVLGLIGWCGN